MNEIRYLLNKMRENVRKARDSHESEKKLRRFLRRSLPGLPKLLSEGGTSSSE